MSSLIDKPNTTSEDVPNPESAEPQALADPAAAVMTCPKCGDRLLNPESLGWCMKCGYCASVAEELNAISEITAANAPKKDSLLGGEEFLQLLRLFPPWLWALAGGSTAVVLTAVGFNLLFDAESFGRTICATIGLAIGLLLMFAAQTSAVMRVSHEDGALTGRHFFFLSPLVWKLVIRKLPKTQWYLYLETWGLTLALSSIFIVGNLLYWGEYYQPRVPVDEELRKVAESRSLNPDSSEADIMKGFEKNSAETPTNVVNPKDDFRPSVQCVVVGFIPDEDNQPSALLLATMHDGKLSYCGTVREGFLPDEVKELQESLAKSMRADPIIKNLDNKVDPNAIWVRAGTYCDIHQSGFDSIGHLIKPSFDRLRGN